MEEIEVRGISALERHVDEWEIYEIASKSISADVEGGKLKSINSSEKRGFAVRVILNDRLGFASSSSLEKAFLAAVKIARISDDNLKSFPSEVSGRRKIEGIYDRRVEKIGPEYLKEEIETLLSAVAFGKVVAASLEHEVAEVKITNSSGVILSENSTTSSIAIEVVYIGEKVGSGYEMDASRSVELDIEKVAKRAETLAVSSAKVDKIPGGYYDVLLEPIGVHQLFFYTLYPSFSAENVLKGRSRLKIGDKYGNLTLTDDPTVKGGLMSFSFDDEGVKARKTVLMEEGVVKSYYTDWKHSFRMDIEPTSNGIRPEISSPPAASPSNVVVDVSAGDEDEYEENRKILRVHSFIGAHTSNPVSGDFSLECMNASLAGKAVKGVMVYGNIFDLLEKFDGGFGEVRQIENTITPPLKFRRVRVVC